ncbi:hypothetical protein JCM8202v2_003815 [Rhodotorula sphaerocarpa]
MAPQPQSRPSHRDVSPPTPAPSPVPQPRPTDLPNPPSSPLRRDDPLSPTRLSGRDSTGAGQGLPDVAELRDRVNDLPADARHRLLVLLLNDTPPLALSPLLPLIQPRLQRDFLRTLPLELALHVLSFVDEPKTLARAAGVSRFWKNLLEDESTWRHMCWKSGFVVPRAVLAPAATASTIPTHPTRSLRDLEIGQREYQDEDEQRYTPAGRERRGTWDRQALLHEFAAHTGSASGAGASGGVAGSAGTGAGATGLGIEQVEAMRRPGSAASGGPNGDEDVYALDRLGQALPPTSNSNSTSPTPRPRTRRPPPIAIASSSTTNHPPQEAAPITLSPTALRGYQEAFGGSGPPLAQPDAQATEPSPSLPPPRRTTTEAVRIHRPRSDAGLPRFEPPALDFEPEGDAEEPTRTSSCGPRSFSYKSHFKYAFQTEQSWLRGPGRLLSTQMSADSGVVTSLAIDDEWIVVGMETSKIHVFEGRTGAYVRTLDGHQTGVWCLALVSRGGGPRSRRGEEDANSSEGGQAHRQGGGDKGRAARSPPPQPPRSAETAHSAFFRPDATPLASSSYSSPDASRESSHSRRAPTREPTRRRRSSFSGVPSSSSPSSEDPDADVESGGDRGSRAGGMGIGAGGPTGDSLLQGSACATARGWGQDGAILVSGGCDRTVRVWDVSTGRCIHTLAGHTSTVRCLRVLDARPVAVSGSRDGSVRVWDIDNGEAVHVLSGHASSLWNVDTGECLHVFRGHFSKIYSVAFDGARVVTGSLDSTVRVWSAQDGTLIALLQGHTTLVGQLQLDPRTDTLLTGGSDGRVLVFSLKSYEARHVLEAHTTSVTCLQFDERFIVTGGNDGRIKLWDFRTGAYIRDMCDQSVGIWRVVIRDDKVVILSRREELVPTPEEPNRRLEKTIMDVRTFRPRPALSVGGAEAEGAPPAWGGVARG